MKKFIQLALFLSLSLYVSASQAQGNACSPFMISVTTIPPANQLICHKYLSINHNSITLNPDWVQYILTRDMALGCGKRLNGFRQDPAVRGKSSSPRDYKNNEYDLGHMAPSDDFRWSDDAQRDTFLTSNVAPQLHDFNAGIWLTLEGMVRTWAYEKGSVIVITGPAYQNANMSMGENQVLIPTGFWKLVLSGQENKFLLFYFDHVANRNKDLTNYIVTPNQLFQKTGIQLHIPQPYTQDRYWNGDSKR